MLEIILYGLCESLITLIFALGFHIIFGLGNVVLLSYGAFCVFGLYVTATLFKMGCLVLFSVMGGLFFALLLSFLFSHFLVSRIQGVLLNEAVVSIAALMLIVEALRMTYGTAPFTFPVLLGQEVISLKGSVFQLSRLLAIPAILLIWLGVWLFLRFSRLGRGIRAMAQNRESALLMGISPPKIVDAIVAVGISVAFIGGLIHLSFVNLSPEMGNHVLLLSLFAVILGGLGSLRGAALASFVLGFSQVLTIVTLGARYKLLIPLIMTFLIIIFRPSGLFGIQSKLEERL